MQWKKMKERITQGCGAKPTIPAKEKTGMKAKAIGKKEKARVSSFRRKGRRDSSSCLKEQPFSFYTLRGRINGHRKERTRTYLRQAGTFGEVISCI